MAAIITNIIPEQNFEKVRDRIGLIIADEFVGQKTLTTNILFDAGVWVERFIPFDNSELPAVNVMFAGTNYENQDPLTSTGINKYYIDVHTHAEDTTSTRGDKVSMQNLHKLLGAIRYILSSIEYRTLGYNTSKFIQNRTVVNIDIYQPKDLGDGLHSATGRITIDVRFNESVGEAQPVDGEEYHTVLKLENTEKGFLYKVIN